MVAIVGFFVICTVLLFLMIGVGVGRASKG
ncbi:hypothetical protein VPHD148_0181 [Vibrio phage D148]